MKEVRPECKTDKRRRRGGREAWKGGREQDKEEMRDWMEGRKDGRMEGRKAG